MTVWWTLGFNAIIYLAGLQDISADLYEAAAIDGANARQQFFGVTLPGLRPVMLFVLTLTILASANMFGQSFLVTQGAPANETRTAIMYIADVGLAQNPAFAHLGGQIAMLAGAVVLNGIASACYIGARFGPGARDGLMTGLARRTGWSVRLSRTLIEVVVLGVGWLLGGSVGVGTVVYAVAIGPLVQLLLPWFMVPAAINEAAAPEPRERDALRS
jgi:ABC-type Fe3+ transport system permease subunit